MRIKESAKGVWKRRSTRVLAAFLTLAMVMQGTNLPAIAEEVIPQEAAVNEASADDAAKTETPAADQGTALETPAEPAAPAGDQAAPADDVAARSGDAAEDESPATPEAPAADQTGQENLAGGGVVPE